MKNYINFLVNYSAASYGANHVYDKVRKEKLRKDYTAMKDEMIMSL